ncbi:MAG: DUF1735 domain-containing protein, partial [Bacteroidales bacterium]|nr:DUF1735 domain-containing protein [Bacteroidales bacterium]
ILMIVAGLFISSCGKYELFEREHYKNVFALLSYESDNIFTEEHDLTDSQTEGYISAVCGGSLPTEKDIDITIVEDTDILSRYNMRFTKEDEYVQLVPRNQYEIASYSIKISAGERTGKTKITMRANGLSPDSVYVIPLKVTKFSSYEVNPDKSYIMYRVLLKNYYAKMNASKTGTTYSLRGKHDNVNVMSTKVLYPVAGDKVRINAGNLTYTASSAISINRTAIVLQIDESNKVHISAWKDIEVEQIDDDPDYPNIFMIEDTGYKKYKTFLLRYDYIYDGVRHSMQEELRYDLENDKQ